MKNKLFVVSGLSGWFSIRDEFQCFVIKHDSFWIVMGEKEN